MSENTTGLAEVTKSIKPFTDKNLSFDEFKDLAKIMAASSFFKDAEEGPKAFAKMLVGRDLGIPITRALCDIQMIQGKPTVSANLIAGLIKRSGKYRYKILKHTNDVCEIECFERVDDIWESLGLSTFSMADGIQAGITGNPVWKKFPRNMLFSRAISNAAKQHFGDIFLGSVYTPDELDPNITLNEDGEVSQNLIPKPKITVKNPVKEDKSKEQVVEGELVESKVELIPTDETIDSLVKDIEDLAGATGFDLDKFLKESKVKSLKSLDASGLRNTRNTLRLRLEVKK